MTRFSRWILAAGLFPAFLALPAPPLAGALDPGRYVVLENGLRVFLYEKRDLPLVHVVTGFDLGSKNETGETNGFVHLLEHAILFRGSGDRAGLRRHGAYFNGSTGQDLAVFEISLPSAHAGFALRSQKDILFGFDLDPRELEAEKEVVLEELGEMEDDPDRAAADRVLREIFRGHPYGRSVYGDRGVIAAATAEGLLAFHRRFFTADNAAMAVVGDFETGEMERLVREVFGDLPRAGHAAAALPMAVPLGKDSVVRLEKDVTEGTLYLAFPAPDYNHPDRYAMRVLVEALGRGINPLLSARLRSERDTVQRVSMSYLEFRYGGAAVVAVKAVPSDLAAVERTALSVLKRAGSENYSKKDFLDPVAEMAAFDFLESAKNQIRFSSGQAEESGLQLAGSFVRHMLLNTREKPGRYLDEIGRIGSGDLRRTAARYFGRADHVVVTVAPRRGGPK
ncbi:MAG: insulinase family protein [Candidatus Aminicenantes bacterium]|nr:insulinase family protein [Candidatus Aminicenantes bacterium]